MRNCIALVAKLEYYTMFINSQTEVPIRIIPTEMGWAQGPTPIQVDSSTVIGITTEVLSQNVLKSMNMRFYWINYRIKQDQFRVYWMLSPDNLEDYHFKHHPDFHHITVMPVFLHVPKPSSLQVCVNLTIQGT